jgi:hypothetical protein
MISFILFLQALLIAMFIVGGLFLIMELLQLILLPEVDHFRSWVYMIFVLILGIAFQIL